MKKMFAIVLTIAVFSLVFCSCVADKDASSVWDDATYTEDTQLGSGNVSFEFAVTAEEKTVNFVIKTDKETVGQALEEIKLIEGEEGPYGLYVKTVNGMFADYEKTHTYWSFMKDGEAMQTGVDIEKIQKNAKYSFEYIKQ